MKKVLLFHTGGTLGMSGSRPAPLSPDRYAHLLLERVPELAQIATVETRILCNLDSSDVGPERWAELAMGIAAARDEDEVDGIVVVHGTDTMAYTASALAFALEGLDRPVILTGSQRPLAAHRTDARRNLADAVEVATRAIPEVAICFDGLLLRGCRATKGDARSYRAFQSPGCAPLATLGLDVDIAAHVRRPDRPFRLDARFDSRVAVLFVTPGLDPAVVEGLMGGPAPPGGVVLAAFGVGTVPTAMRPLAPVLARAVQAGIDVLAVTQAGGGIVDLGLYENSLVLEQAGVIAGGAMRLEAATAKLMHALAAYEDRTERRAYLERDVAGER